ncbi:MAG TPA: hypothetical protein VMN56_15420 [Casimicrobiaceae bacterium]|nr:hypothetical protein [Casimicrobiaceae bacterium]
MINLLDRPVIFFLGAFAVFAVAAWTGERLGARRTPAADEDRSEFDIVQGATLTLLGLIIGFTFSMALNRYDQRKNYEEEEANAIGTEFLRADLLPPADAAKVRALLLQYLDERIRFYTLRDDDQLRQSDALTAKLQAELWTAVKTPALAQPSPVAALAVSGMNDVVNTQGYTQAAWWNRIPASAWALMAAISVCANMLVGVGAKKTKRRSALFLVLPFVVALAFFLIADIDAPRRGVILVKPQNLENLVQSLRAQ